MTSEITPQPIEEHTITLVLPSTESEACSNYDQLKAEIQRLLAAASQGHPGQHLTYCLKEFIEINEQEDLHIYKLQIMG